MALPITEDLFYLQNIVEGSLISFNLAHQMQAGGLHPISQDYNCCFCIINDSNRTQVDVLQRVLQGFGIVADGYKDQHSDVFIIPISQNMLILEEECAEITQAFAQELRTESLPKPTPSTDEESYGFDEDEYAVWVDLQADTREFLASVQPDDLPPAAWRAYDGTRRTLERIQKTEAAAQKTTPADNFESLSSPGTEKAKKKVKKSHVDALIRNVNKLLNELSTIKLPSIDLTAYMRKFRGFVGKIGTSKEKAPVVQTDCSSTFFQGEAGPESADTSKDPKLDATFITIDLNH